jgi:hypothetical protein
MSSNGLLIHRVWAMPSKWTFEVPVIMELVHKYAGDGTGWIDPFAGVSTFAEWRNDLNPAHKQPYQLEALQFLEDLEHEQKGWVEWSAKGVIFDPPYSLTQVSRSYQDMGLKFKGAENPTGGFPKVRDAIARLVPSGRHVISFVWNTVGMGIKRGFEQVEILIVCHGGNRNDTLCTVERKVCQTRAEGTKGGGE